MQGEGAGEIRHQVEMLSTKADELSSTPVSHSGREELTAHSVR